MCTAYLYLRSIFLWRIKYGTRKEVLLVFNFIEFEESNVGATCRTTSKDIKEAFKKACPPPWLGNLLCDQMCGTLYIVV